LASGAGIAGLMSAIALMKFYKDTVTSVNSGSSDRHLYQKLEIAIFESAEKLEPIGAGIGVWPREYFFVVLSFYNF
jgi:2-polyprenyl-6-methoxyphenol hydroxylase-like FAD-dependent oxidoreductase